MIWDFLPRYLQKVLLLPKVLLGFLFCLPRRFIQSVYQGHRNFTTTMSFNICGPGDQKFKNVILLSVSFMLVFTAFQTLTNIEQTVLDSISKHDPSFTGNGFVSLAIIYFFFSISNWFAPSIVAKFGAKRTMIMGGIIYSAFISSFLYPNTYLLYSMSALLGIGAASIWTAQGNYLTLSSTRETMSRNAGMFWAILQCSMLFGNSFVCWQFSGNGDIEKDTRTVVFSVLTALSIVGVICLVFLRPIIQDGDLNPQDGQNQEGAYDALKKSFRLFLNKKMILLSFTFFYTGIELSFYSGVYSTCVGFTMVLSEAKRLVGLCGILVGAGEVLGGVSFGLLGSRTIKYGRDPIIFLGFLSHMIAFYLIFINLPNQSPLGQTYATSYVDPPWVGLIMVSAFLLGFGDSCFNTQIFSILGGIFSGDSASAFALFKFTQSAAAAASFFYSSELNLLIQLSILVVTCLIGTMTFFIVEWSEVSLQHYKSIQSILTSADISEDGQLFDDDDNQEEVYQHDT